MARARSGQAPAWPLSSDRSVRRGSRGKRDFACTCPGSFTCARCPAVAVTLGAGGAGTYTQRAIPGSEPSQDSCTFRRHPDLTARRMTSCAFPGVVRGHHCDQAPGNDPLIRRSLAGQRWPALPQVSQCAGLSGSDRAFPALTAPSGTQRAAATLASPASGAFMMPGRPPRGPRQPRVVSCTNPCTRRDGHAHGSGGPVYGAMFWFTWKRLPGS